MFLYFVLIRGFLLIEKILTYNIYINKSNIIYLQNNIKKVIDLYFKFIDQILLMNNNINLSIKDAEIFIYKKFIDKTLNDFKILSNIDINYINIIKLNNKYLIEYIDFLNIKEDIYNFDCKNILQYYKKINKKNYIII